MASIGLLFLALLPLVCILHLARRRHRLPLPPGPKGWPLVGNLFNMPKGHLWIGFAKWAKSYNSDIISLDLAGKNVIILSSLAAAYDLLEQRSSNYSTKARMPMINEIMGWEFSFAFMKYGPTWRKHRKFMQASFSNAAVVKFHPHILKSVHTFMRNLLLKPDEFRYYAHYMTAELILSITYGIKIDPRHDPYIEIVDKAVAAVVLHGMPGKYWVDGLPWLKHVPAWMPFAYFQRVGRQSRKYVRDMVEIPYRAVRDDILAGKGIDSLVADGLQRTGDQSDIYEYEDMVKSVAASLYAAASDTSVAFVHNSILALMCYPDVLRKAQAEIDTVIKPGDLPKFSDQGSLPYLCALVKEIMRWAPVAPLGNFHANETADEYKGYRIPANSMVIGNIWAMMHDESTYPDPFTLNPERFLKDDKLNADVFDPINVVFGFGRRICPGRHLASLSSWMTVACIVALFDISKPINEDGRVIEPSMEWDTSGISRPLPFKCKIAPRSERASLAIQRTELYEYFN